jgi:hypothetical protein
MSEYQEVSLHAAELRQSADVDRPVRSSCVASADDSLTMIIDRRDVALQLKT